MDRSKQDENALYGGDILYPFSSHNASAIVSRTGSFESQFNARSGTRSSHRGMTPITQEFKIIKSQSSLETDQNVEDVELRTVSQRAAAVTTAIISCAVGFACAENFIYVFFLGANSTQEELRMLLFRSIFPVHALCGAMQSIGIIRKFIEEDTSIHLGTGKMVLPAIILHGCFDSVIMSVNEYIELSWDNYNKNMDGGSGEDYTPYNSILVNLIAGMSIIGVMLFGFFWYSRQHKSQKVRLKAIQSLCMQRSVPRYVPSGIC